MKEAAKGEIARLVGLLQIGGRVHDACPIVDSPCRLRDGLRAGIQRSFCDCRRRLAIPRCHRRQRVASLSSRLTSVTLWIPSALFWSFRVDHSVAQTTHSGNKEPRHAESLCIATNRASAVVCYREVAVAEASYERVRNRIGRSLCAENRGVR